MFLVVVSSVIHIKVPDGPSIYAFVKHREWTINPPERCAICGCRIHRDGDYATPTVKGRSHATKHHYVPERFFGRSANRKGTVREPIFKQCPWESEGKTVLFCYECHEELLHNPVFLPEDIKAFAALVKARGLDKSVCHL